MEQDPRRLPSGSTGREAPTSFQEREWTPRRARRGFRRAGADRPANRIDPSGGRFVATGRARSRKEELERHEEELRRLQAPEVTRLQHTGITLHRRHPLWVGVQVASDRSVSVLIPILNAVARTRICCST